MRFWMCWCRFLAGTSVLPDSTAWTGGYIFIIISVIYIYTHLYISYLLVIDHNNLMNNGLAGQQPTPETTRNCRIRIVAVRE